MFDVYTSFIHFDKFIFEHVENTGLFQHQSNMSKKMGLVTIMQQMEKTGTEIIHI